MDNLVSGSQLIIDSAEFLKQLDIKQLEQIEPKLNKSRVNLSDFMKFRRF
jgi:hypothetical protein